MDSKDLKIARLEREQDKLIAAVEELSNSISIMATCLDVEKMKSQGKFAKVLGAQKRAILLMDDIIDGE